MSNYSSKCKYEMFCFFSEENNGLERMLVFVTGFDKVPRFRLGFEPPLLLFFTQPIHEHESAPFTGTCATQLHIPVMDCFETFKGRTSLAMDVDITLTKSYILELPERHVVLYNYNSL